MYPRVSWSVLQKFERCGMSLKLWRDRKRAPLDPRWVTVGNSAHFAMSFAITFGGDFSPEALEGWALGDFHRRVAELRPRWTQDEFMEQRAKVVTAARNTATVLQQLADSPGGDGHWKFPVWHTEAEVRKFYRGGWAIDGVIDLAIFDEAYGEGWSIYDLKTGSWEWDQLCFYDVLIEEVTGSPAKRLAVIEPLGRGLVTQPFHAEEREAMRQRIAACARAMKAEQWDFNGYPDRCSWCQSKAWCPKWENARAGTLA